MATKKVPDKVIGRLTKYRSILSEHLTKEKRHIYSHELASLMGLTSSQVRRDFMVIGYSGVPKWGYEIDELARHIGALLDSGGTQKIAVVGMGNLGRALIIYLEGRRSHLQVVAAFDKDPNKVSRMVNGVYCHSMDKLEQVVKEENIRMAIICVPGAVAQQEADRLIHAGVCGILNFAPVPIRVPTGVTLEEIDVTCSLEKVAYFTTHSARGEKGSNEKR